jgi:type II secretory pathway pseudopilin PulG
MPVNARLRRVKTMNNRGFTLLNVIISLGITATLLLTLNQAIQWTSRSDRAAQERIQAAWAAHGILESVRAGVYPLKDFIEKELIIRPSDPDILFEVSLSAQKSDYENLWEVSVRVQWTSLSGQACRLNLNELMAGGEAAP